MKRIFGIAVLLMILASTTAWAQRPNTRQGFWFGFGLGSGSVGSSCGSCSSDRLTAGSGYISLGGTLSPQWLLGAEIQGWGKDDGGINKELGTGMLTAVFYPNPTGAFFLKGGIGSLTYVADNGSDRVDANAAALSVGFGYDIRVARNFALTPYLDATGSGNASLRFDGDYFTTGEDISYSFVQIGLAAHWF